MSVNDTSSSSWGRLFHLGPLFTLGITKIIVWSTIHCNSIWWPPSHSVQGFFNSAIFICLSGATLYNFLSSLYNGPGHVTLGWKPDKEDDVANLQFCIVCQGYKAPRSHHCRKCQRCVLKRDHHCVFINNCLGHQNHTNFMAFLISAIIGCAQAAVIIFCTLNRALNPISYYYDDYYMNPRDFPPNISMGIGTFFLCLFSLGLAIGVVFAVGFLFTIQMKAILKNCTGIEEWVLEKAAYRREGTGEVFQHPYNLGWKANAAQIFNWALAPKGDGITWEIREDCNPYTFTIEQIKQKEFKRERSIEYRVVESYSGKWFPVRLGWRVFIQPPCTDEKRIQLQVGDQVAVTRWKRHWLYGEVCERDQQQLCFSERRTLRGWFPRLCCTLSVVESHNKED